MLTELAHSHLANRDYFAYLSKDVQTFLAADRLIRSRFDGKPATIFGNIVQATNGWVMQVMNGRGSCDYAFASNEEVEEFRKHLAGETDPNEWLFEARES